MCSLCFRNGIGRRCSLLRPAMQCDRAINRIQFLQISSTDVKRIPKMLRQYNTLITTIPLCDTLSFEPQSERMAEHTGWKPVQPCCKIYCLLPLQCGPIHISSSRYSEGSSICNLAKWQKINFSSKLGTFNTSKCCFSADPTS